MMMDVLQRTLLMRQGFVVGSAVCQLPVLSKMLDYLLKPNSLFTR